MHGMEVEGERKPRKRRETGGDGVTREVGAEHEQSISGQVVVSACATIFKANKVIGL